MKAFFITLLLVSIVFPFYSFITSMPDFAHNQWRRRSERLEDAILPKTPSAHLGLTAAQLHGVDELVTEAYKDAVYDGFRLGSGYQRLSLQALGLDVLLFIASLVGLRACRTRSPSNQSLQPTAGRSDV